MPSMKIQIIVMSFNVLSVMFGDVFSVNGDFVCAVVARNYSSVKRRLSASRLNSIPYCLILLK